MPSQRPIESCYQARIRHQSDIRPELFESVGVDDFCVFPCIQIQLLNRTSLTVASIMSEYRKKFARISREWSKKPSITDTMPFDSIFYYNTLGRTWRHGLF